MITITERKLQTYLYSLIIITPNTKYDCSFRHIFRQKLVRSLFGQYVRRPMIRLHFSGAHFFWDPFVRGPFVRGAHLSGAHSFRGLFVRKPMVLVDFKEDKKNFSDGEYSTVPLEKYTTYEIKSVIDIRSVTSRA